MCIMSVYVVLFSVPEPALLVTYITVTDVSGSSAEVCVETNDAATVELILIDATEQRYTRDSEK